jgi:hypothetical protein
MNLKLLPAGGGVSSAPFPTATSLASRPSGSFPDVFRMVCMDCAAELPGSVPTAARTSHGLCRACFNVRMAELNNPKAA